MDLRRPAVASGLALALLLGVAVFTPAAGRATLHAQVPGPSAEPSPTVTAAATPTPEATPAPTEVASPVATQDPVPPAPPPPPPSPQFIPEVEGVAGEHCEGGYGHTAAGVHLMCVYSPDVDDTIWRVTS